MIPLPFTIGDRVICIDAHYSYLHLSRPQPAAPVEGQTYTVRGLAMGQREGWPMWGIMLEGITCEVASADGIEWRWGAHRFRRVDGVGATTL